MSEGQDTTRFGTPGCAGGTACAEPECSVCHVLISLGERERTDPLLCDPCAQTEVVRFRAAAEKALAWTQGCVVRAAHGLALALKGDGIDGADLRETAVGVSSGLMEVDARISELIGTAAQPPPSASVSALVTPQGEHPETCPVPGSHTRTSCNYFRERLAKYGQHLRGCTVTSDPTVCSCGLAQELAAKAMATTVVRVPR